MLPKQVFDELSNPSIPHIKRKVHDLCLRGDVFTKEILVNTDEYKLYHELAVSPPKGERVIGIILMARRSISLDEKINKQKEVVSAPKYHLSST